MKKAILILSLFFVLMTTGCVKVEYSVDIKKDKSMKLSLIEAVETSKMDKETKILSEEALEDLKKQGFEVENYKDDTYTGFKILKSFKNIDDISSENHVEFILSKDDNVFDKIFTVKKGLFKNTYTLTGKVNTSNLKNKTTDTKDMSNTKEVLVKKVENSNGTYMKNVAESLMYTYVDTVEKTITLKILENMNEDYDGEYTVSGNILAKNTTILVLTLKDTPKYDSKSRVVVKDGMVVKALLILSNYKVSYYYDDSTGKAIVCSTNEKDYLTESECRNPNSSKQNTDSKNNNQKPNVDTKDSKQELTPETKDDTLNDEIFDELIKNSKMNFVLNIPFKVMKTNAKKSNGGKTLTWNLSDSTLDSLNAKFYLYNYANIYIALLILGLVIVLIIILLLLKKRNDKELLKSFKIRKKEEEVLELQRQEEEKLKEAIKLKEEEAKKELPKKEEKKVNVSNKEMPFDLNDGFEPIDKE